MSGRGFTLLEVMLALTLLAIMVVALGRVSSTQLAGAARADHLLWAEVLAENELNRVLAAAEPPPLGRRARAIGHGEQQWRLAVSVSATDVDTLRRVEIDVTEEPGGQQLASLVGFRGLH